MSRTLKRPNPGTTLEELVDYSISQLIEMNAAFSGAISVSVSSNTGGFTEKVSTSITTDAVVAYADGDNIGGVLEVALRRANGASGVFNDVSFWSKENQKPNLYIYVFAEEPVAGTYDDNLAMVVDGDEDSFLGMFEILASDWRDCGTISVCSLAHIGITVPEGAANDKIYFTIMTKTAITYTSVSGLYFKSGILQD